LKQGTQRSPVPHTSVGKSFCCDSTMGMQVERQRPSEPAIEVHAFGFQ